MKKAKKVRVENAPKTPAAGSEHDPYKDSRANVALLIEELRAMTAPEHEGASDEVVGVVVFVQRRNGAVYPHSAGDCDIGRVAGIASAYLSAMVNDRILKPWLAAAYNEETKSWDRQLLERGCA